MTTTATEVPAKSFNRIEAIGKTLAKSKTPLTKEALIKKSDALYAGQGLKSKKSNLKQQEWELNWALQLLLSAEVLKIDDKGKYKL